MIIVWFRDAVRVSGMGHRGHPNDPDDATQPSP
jgi:hypothetical protein